MDNARAKQHPPTSSKGGPSGQTPAGFSAASPESASLSPLAEALAGAGVSAPVPAPDHVRFYARSMTPDERAAWEWKGIPRDEASALAWLLLRWKVDPIFFAIEALRILLHAYQGQVLLDLADAPREVYEFHGLDPTFPKRQVLVPSGHGLGKTRVLAVAIWWHLLTHKFSKTICTAPTSDQLTGQLWGEVRKMYRRLKAKWPDLAGEWEVLTDTIRHSNPDYGDWVVLARTARAEKPEGLQGAHALDEDDAFGELAALFGEERLSAPSGGILVIIEEASGVEDTVRETLEGSLSEAGARLLAPGNPTRADGWFARDIDRTDRFAVHPLDCRMSNREQVYARPYRDFGGRVHQLRLRGFVRPAYWEEILRECDGNEDADRFKVRVRGVKPHSNFDSCIKAHWVEQAEKRAPDELSKAEPIIIGLDFGLTNDKHALAVRQGFNLLDGDEWLPKDTPEEITLDAADRAIEAQKRLRAKFIVGDSNGVGRGAMEYLHRHYTQGEGKGLGVTVVFFNSGEGALDSKRYYRRRDEMWFSKGRPWFSNPRCSIPSLPGLKSQLTATQYHEDDRRKIRVESKDDIKARSGQASGNLADAALTTLMVVTFAPVEEKPKAEDVIPEVFKKHFARLRQRALGDSGYFIR